MLEGWIPLLTAQLLNTVEKLVLTGERNGPVRADGDTVAAQDHALVKMGHASAAVGGIKHVHVVRAELHALAAAAATAAINRRSPRDDFPREAPSVVGCVHGAE